MAENKKSSLLEKFVPVLLLISVALAFMVGVLWQKVSNLEGGKVGTTTTTTGGAVTITKELLATSFENALVKFGDTKSKNVIIEVADPSCPYCHIAGGKNPELAAQVGDRFKYKSEGGSYNPPVTEIKKLVDEGKASYAFIYRNGHGNGEMGTKALYCANDMGKFWEVHDKLFSNAGYELLNNVVLNDKAKSKQLTDFLAGAVDTAKLKECIDSGKYDSRLATDEGLAGDLGVTGTPGYYINTSNFAGAYSWDDMKSSIE